MSHIIRENQKYLNKLQIILDLFFVVLAFGLAHYIRFYLLNNGNLSLSRLELFQTLAVILPIYMILYHLFDLYSTRRTKPFQIEVVAILKTNLLATTLLMMGLFLFKMVNFSRLVLIVFFCINISLTISSRLVIRYVLKKYRRLGYNLKHCLIIGTTPSSKYFIDKVRKNPHWGYHLVGVLGSSYTKPATSNAPVTSDTLHSSKLLNPMDTVSSLVLSAAAEASATLDVLDTSQDFVGIPVLGTLDQFEKVLANRYLDMVIIGTASDDLSHLGKILQLCEKSGVKTQIIPYYYEYIPAKPYMDDLDGLPIIDIRHVPLDNMFKSMAKRTFDILFSLGVILLSSPLLLFSALMVRLSSPGPILFKQERVGLNRKNFYMYKFRSMKLQTEEDEKAKWTTKNDPRKTRWGTFMRKTSIDELPQFFNVLMGDMSVVGPRPERPFFVDKFKEDIPRYMIKHQVRPGITGWAQVNGFRGDTSIEGRIDHDLYYIENWTFTFDIKIIFMTLVTGFVNKNAY